ncbi:MAG: hypothetical protein WBR15_00970 [Gammaproteobacteria bacterium]
MKLVCNLLMLALLLLPPCAVACTTDSANFDLLKAMSAADYRATGLDRLSESQLKALNDWFSNYEKQQAGTCAQAAANASNPVTPVSKSAFSSSEKGVIHLIGPFTGWSGNTVFKLDNGQTWEQTDDGILSIAPISHAEVTITKGVFNAYYLSVKGLTDSVQVRRIQ